MEDLGEVGVLAHPVAAAADVDDMAVMQQAIDERSGHDLVAQDLAPLLEAFIGGQHSGCALIAPVDELEEEHGAGLADRQVADLVDDQERRTGEDLEAASQLAGGLGFFERGDEVGRSTVVDSAPALRRLTPPHGEVAEALAKVRDSESHAGVRLALEFMVLTATRSNEVRGAACDEVELDVWTIPADRMKAKREHRVPLSGRALEILEEARKLHGGGGIVFRGTKGGRIHASMFSKLLRRLGIAGTPHGMRSSFRDWCSETGVAREVAEAALAHKVRSQAEARLRPLGPAGPEARGHAGLGRVSRWQASRPGGQSGPLRRWLMTRYLS